MTLWSPLGAARGQAAWSSAFCRGWGAWVHQRETTSLWRPVEKHEPTVGRVGHNKWMTPDIYPMSAMFGLKPCSSLSCLTLSNPLVAQMESCYLPLCAPRYFIPNLKNEESYIFIVLLIAETVLNAVYTIRFFNSLHVNSVKWVFSPFYTWENWGDKVSGYIPLPL